MFDQGHFSGVFKVWMTFPELCCIPSPAGLPAGPYRARLLRAGMQEQRSSVRKHSVGISGESQTRQARAVYAVNLTSALEAPASSITSHPLTPLSTSHWTSTYVYIHDCSIMLKHKFHRVFTFSKWNLLSSLFVSSHVCFHAKVGKTLTCPSFSDHLASHSQKTNSRDVPLPLAGKCPPASEIPTGKHGMVIPSECEPIDDRLLFTPHD